MIPSIRGRLRSREIDDIVCEAQNLERSGVKELSLVAQDLTAYGLDLYHSRSLERLIGSLLKNTAIPWIRLMYLYPSTISEELLDIVAGNERIVPYLDIPLQHISTRILTGMNRRYSKDDVFALLDMIRKTVPRAALRTTFLLGFPGEIEDDVEQIEEFLRIARFDHVGVFGYANEEGCSAERMSGQVADDEKEERLKRIVAIQSAISQEKLQRFVNTTEQVLVEGFSKETDLLLEGRTRFQAPDIDGCVLINEGETSPGEIVDIEITEAQTYDLVGRIV